MTKTKVYATLALIAVVSVFYSVNTFSHCQIPCGIYGDETRFALLEEHIATIEKSMTQIEDIMAQEGKPDANQVVRWVQNKETHTDEFSHIVTYYFMTQRIKIAEKGSADYAAYQQKIELLHQMLVFSMKCKQTTDTANTAKLKELVGEFRKVYFAQ